MALPPRQKALRLVLHQTSLPTWHRQQPRRRRSLPASPTVSWRTRSADGTLWANSDFASDDRRDRLASLLKFGTHSKLFLVVYVDDFKMSGPQVNMARGWKLIQSRLNLGDPAPSSLYLGCTHECKPITLNNGKRGTCSCVQHGGLPEKHRGEILQFCEAEQGEGPHVETSQHSLSRGRSQGRSRCSADIGGTGGDLPVVPAQLPVRRRTRWRSRHGQQNKSSG